MHIPTLQHHICLGQSYFLRIFARFSEEENHEESRRNSRVYKNPKISMKCSIFRTHGKSENWICIFIWLKSLETKTWKCEFLTFYKLTEWNGTESNTFFTSNRKTTENNFVFSIFEKIEKFRVKIIWIKLTWAKQEFSKNFIFM